VPEVSVIQEGLAVFVLIERKGLVDGFFLLNSKKKFRFFYKNNLS